MPAGPPSCPVCAGARSLPCLLDRPDYEYDVPTRLSYWRCQDPRCAHVFASPLPDTNTLVGFYREYSTHAAPRTPPALLRRLLWFANSAGLRRISKLPRNIRILDFGCGGGGLLTELHARGFRDLHGHDADIKALRAVPPGIATLHDSAEAALASGPFDLVVLNHVIEHLPDPAEVLHRLLGALAPGGQLRLRTPNTASNLARWTGDRWRGWETPRHLNLFSPNSLARLSELSDCQAELQSSNAMFLGIFQGSCPGAQASSRLRRYGRHALAMSAWLGCEMLRLVRPLSGEELCLQIYRTRPVRSAGSAGGSMPLDRHASSGDQKGQ